MVDSAHSRIHATSAIRAAAAVGRLEAIQARISLAQTYCAMAESNAALGRIDKARSLLHSARRIGQAVRRHLARIISENSRGIPRRPKPAKGTFKTIDLPENGCLAAIAKSIESAMQTGKPADVRRPCANFLAEAARYLAAAENQALDTRSAGAARRVGV